MFEAEESALTIFSSFLPTSLRSFFGVSICGAGNFMIVLRVRATMLLFFQAVGFSKSPVLLPNLRRFRNVAWSDF